MGPVCWEKAGGVHQLTITEEPRPPWFRDLPDPGPNGFGGIKDVFLLRGKDGVARVSCPWRTYHHSPSGLEWGYGGSGPADLALNILLCCTDKQTAFQHHQAFKSDAIAKVPAEGDIIRLDDVRRWLRTKT